MATLLEQQTKAKKLTPKRIEADLFKFIRSIEKEFIELNKSQIRDDSQDIFGNPIGYYSFFTDHLTNGRKKAGKPFTGVDTGDWFKGFYMQEVSGVLRFYSKDPKTSLILSSDDWLSNELFGLTDKNLKGVIASRLLPFILRNTRNILDI